MKLKFRYMSDGSLIQYVGSLKHRDIVVIIGRDNIDKDSTTLEAISRSLFAHDFTFAWYEFPGPSTRPRLMGRYARFPGFIRRAIKDVLLVWHLKHWAFFSPKRLKKVEQISFRRDCLKRFIQRLGPDKRLIILAHSGGGRVASLIAEDVSISKLVCLGYPFQHPDVGPEADRVVHLKTLKTPFLILQGVRDIYGGANEVQSLYELSSSIRVEPVEADHEFELSADERARVISLVQGFIAV